NFSPHAFRFARQVIEIRSVNRPGHDVGSIQIVICVHRAPSISDCIASASWTARCETSSWYRVQQMSQANAIKAIQLLTSTHPMRGSSEPPPPITGAGCWVRKNQMEKYTSGTSRAPNIASTAASSGVWLLEEKRRKTR